MKRKEWQKQEKRQRGKRPGRREKRHGKERAGQKGRQGKGEISGWPGTIKHAEQKIGRSQDAPPRTGEQVTEKETGQSLWKKRGEESSERRTSVPAPFQFRPEGQQETRRQGEEEPRSETFPEVPRSVSLSGTPERRVPEKFPPVLSGAPVGRTVPALRRTGA